MCEYFAQFMLVSVIYDYLLLFGNWFISLYVMSGCMYLLVFKLYLIFMVVWHACLAIDVQWYSRFIYVLSRIV